MEPIGTIIKADRIAQGLSLQGLADSLNDDRSLGLDKRVTTSWLHHLENGRAKALSTILKKGLARALHQEESKYLSANESLDKRRSAFAKFFDEQLNEFEQGSTLVCDFQIDPNHTEEVGELLLCLYHFLVATDGKVVAFERSARISLPILLLAIKAWPNIDDSNPNSVVSKILAPVAAGGFIDCSIPEPTQEMVSWVTSRVDVFELAADEQATGLMATDPMSYVGVISPNAHRGKPRRKLYYYLNPREYGTLPAAVGDQVYQRFANYRDLKLFTKCDFAPSFAFSYRDIGAHYHLDFGGSAASSVAV